jgi:hypothetical protein
MLRKIAAAVALCLSALSPARGDALPEGTWHGTLKCEKLPWTKGPQVVPIDIALAGAAVTFARQIYNSNDTAVIGSEEGAGTIAADGTIRLTSAWKAPGPNPHYSFTARYAGTIAASGGSLGGVQVWTAFGKTVDRDCTITLDRPPAPGAGSR